MMHNWIVLWDGSAEWFRRRVTLRAPGAAERFLETPITFAILDSPDINAMAIPGGHIYVTRGLLAHLNSAQSQDGQIVRLLVYFVEHRGRVFQLWRIPRRNPLASLKTNSYE